MSRSTIATGNQYKISQLEIKSEPETKIIYGSVNPTNGELVQYSPDQSKIINQMFIDNKIICHLETKWGKCTIQYEEDEDLITQLSENGGYRTCFRKNVPPDTKILKIAVKYDTDEESWYIDDVEQYKISQLEIKLETGSEIKPETKIIYGSVNPTNGELVQYSPDQSKIINQMFIDNKIICHLETKWGKCTIQYEEDEDLITQLSENGGYRTCFRKNVPPDTKILKIAVKYDTDEELWVSNDKNPPEHWIFVVDRSGSMSNILTKLLEEMYNECIKPLNEVTSPVFVTFITFDTYTNVELNTVKFEDIDFEKIIKNIRAGASTRLFDTIKDALEIGNRISNKCALTNLIIVTDGMDNNSTNWSQSVMKSELEKVKTCENPWNVIMIGINAFDAEHQNYGIGTGGIMNSSNLSETFRSLSNAVSRTRSGETNGIIFSALERTSSGSSQNMQQHMQTTGIRNLNSIHPPVLSRQASVQICQEPNLTINVQNLDNNLTSVNHPNQAPPAPTTLSAQQHAEQQVDNMDIHM